MNSQPFSKPHSAPLLHAAKSLCIEPCESLFIGDVKNDIISAKNTGVHSGVAT
ncbi:MAG: HAD hydrolase-like protein [Aliivibrio sp.]|nr:HAD hydrolase-like protein [Aliivibrio sp.]